MRKIILLLLLSIISLTNIYSQTGKNEVPVFIPQDGGTPGFGTEGGGDAQTAPVYPISNELILGLTAGILLAGYFFYKKKKTA